MKREKNEVSALFAETYPIGRAIQFCICRNTPQQMWMNIVANKTTSIILIRGNVAIKCAAALNGPGSVFRSIRLIERWTGRNVIRNKPASAITNFLDIEENRILLIGYQVFRVILIVRGRKFIKVNCIISKLQ
jgi:hypothetical protein